MRSIGRQVVACYVAAVVALVGGAASAWSAPGASPQRVVAERRLDALQGYTERPDAIRLGAQLDWANDTPQAFQERTGLQPAVYGEFVEFPFNEDVAGWLNTKVERVKAAGAVFMLTLEPGIGKDQASGLDAVTPESLAALTKTLRTWNADGVPVIVRFGQEMNGAWYPWSQDPQRYIGSFRQVADAVHSAPQSRMLWSPNEGGGYPYDGGRYQAKSGTAAFALLDTDHDGKLTQKDDPYRPYWPGSQYVDWVGLSLYHFGDRYPWGTNVAPDPGKFVGKMTGTYTGGDGDEGAVPNFYAQYAKGEDKPMMISETSALFHPAINGAPATGATNEQIKAAWMDQVFAPDIPRRFPRLRLINWFEQSKIENDPNGTPVGGVDWRISSDPAVLADFRARLPQWLVVDADA